MGENLRYLLFVVERYALSGPTSDATAEKEFALFGLLHFCKVKAFLMNNEIRNNYF